MSKKLDNYIDEVMSNIRNDRKITRELLDVETLQRSNEQLVKIAGMVSKSSANEGLSSKDMEDIYNALADETKENK